MNLGESIRINTAWILTGNLGGRILGFLFGVALARILVPADFGMLVTIQIFTGVAGYFSAGGMGEALVQAKTVEEHHYQVVFTLQFLVCVLIYLGFFIIAPSFAVWFDNPLYADLLRVSALSFLIRPFVNIMRARLKREMRFKVIAVSRFVSGLFGGVSSVGMALRGLGPWSLLFGGLFGTLVHLTMLTVVTRWRPGFRFEKSVARRLGSFGAKASANEIVRYLRTQTGNLIISRLMGPAPLGLFNKANSLSMLPVQVIAGSVYPTVFRALSTVQDSLGQSKYIYFRTITLGAVYTLPFYVGLLWLAEPLILVVYGPQWGASAVPLQILAIAGLCRSISTPSGAVVAAQNRLGYEMRIQLETWLLLAIGCLIGVRWGFVGVAWGVLPSFIYHALRMSWLANKCIRGRFTDLLRALYPALVLNLGLAIALLIAHLSLPADLRTNQTAVYLLAMSAVGGLAYGIFFLYAPIPTLATESGRWKRKLGLAAG